VPPPSKNKLPELKSDFADNDAKGKFVTELLEISTKAMTDADAEYSQFSFAEAHSEYLVSLDGFLHLMKITKDDANFQTYIRSKMNYLLDRGEKCKTTIKTQMN
jgi:hypothetical protein